VPCSTVLMQSPLRPFCRLTGYGRVTAPHKRSVRKSKLPISHVARRADSSGTGFLLGTPSSLYRPRGEEAPVCTPGCTSDRSLSRRTPSAS
jgi:hypothetical protein